MHKIKNTNVESLLAQIELVEPSKKLDESVSNLACAKSPLPRSGWNWSLTGVVAGIAALVGMAIGVGTFAGQTDGNLIAKSSLTKVSDDVRVFQAMHGHSGHQNFQNCSDCHAFADKKSQKVVKWVFDTAIEHIHAYGTNCNMCHIVQTETHGKAD